MYLKYIGVFAGGELYAKYWDYRNNKWNSDPCFTFTAYFSDQHLTEVTLPVKDFFFKSYAKYQAERMLRVLGKTPTFSRSWLKTIAINGDGVGARAGSNSGRLSMTLNLAPWVIRNAYKLFYMKVHMLELFSLTLSRVISGRELKDLIPCLSHFTPKIIQILRMFLKVLCPGWKWRDIQMHYRVNSLNGPYQID